MANYVVLKRVAIGPRHRATGRTRHYDVSGLLPPASELCIVQYEGDSGFYLLYFDSGGHEMTDTYHDSVEEAMAQADFESEVKPGDWLNAVN